MMPEMDGITLCKKIKQNININHVPVILLTAKGKLEDYAEGMDIGADAYMVKPFNVEILRKTISNLITNRKLLRNKFSGMQQQEEKLEVLNIKPTDEILMEKIMKIINDNLAEPTLDVEMLAKNVGLSRVHLYRKLKELTNLSTRDPKHSHPAGSQAPKEQKDEYIGYSLFCWIQQFIAFLQLL